MLISFFWTYLFGTLASVVVMLSVEQPILPDTITDHLACLGTRSMQCIDRTNFHVGNMCHRRNTANILYSTSIIYMVVAQYTFFKNIVPGNGNWIEIVGVCCVIIGFILSSIVQLFNPRKVSTEDFVSTDTEEEKLSSLNKCP